MGIELPYKLPIDSVYGYHLLGRFYEIPISAFTTYVKYVKKTV